MSEFKSKGLKKSVLNGFPFSEGEWSPVKMYLIISEKGSKQANSY